MYQRHQPIIAAWARKSPENLARVIQFCIISMRRRFYLVPALVEEAEQEGSGALYGWKHAAYREAWENRDAIYWNCEDIARTEDPGDRADYLLAYLASLYGLNVAKAGFVCQLAYGLSGCLDTVNVQRLGLRPRAFANFSQLKTPQGRQGRAVQYNAVVREAGGTETLWNAWCASVSERYPAQFPTPNHVSALHLECLGIT